MAEVTTLAAELLKLRANALDRRNAAITDAEWEHWNAIGVHYDEELLALRRAQAGLARLA